MTCGGWKNPEYSKVLFSDAYNGKVTTHEPGQCSGFRYTAEGELDKYSCDCSDPTGIFTEPAAGAAFKPVVDNDTSLQIQLDGDRVGITYPTLSFHCPNKWKTLSRAPDGSALKDGQQYNVCAPVACGAYCDESGKTCSDHINYLVEEKNTSCAKAIESVKQECPYGTCDTCDQSVCKCPPQYATRINDLVRNKLVPCADAIESVKKDCQPSGVCDGCTQAVCEPICPPSPFEGWKCSINNQVPDLHVPAQLQSTFELPGGSTAAVQCASFCNGQDPPAGVVGPVTDNRKGGVQWGAYFSYDPLTARDTCFCMNSPPTHPLVAWDTPETRKGETVVTTFSHSPM